MRIVRPSDGAVAAPAALVTPSADGVQPAHPCQWWYWSGQLRGASGRRYGFQLAFFAAEAVRGLLWGQMAHWAVVELGGGRFRSGSRVWLGAPRRVEGRFELACDGAAARGGDGLDRLRLDLGGDTLDLTLRGDHVVPHYDGRRHDYAFGGYTYYYSRPRMRAVGELRGRGGHERIEGDVWFDRQYGDLSSALVEGWQWFSAHLDDGQQIMVFSFNNAAAERFGAIVDASGQARWLGPDALHIEPRARWRSPRSGVDYPCAWRLRTDAHDLEIWTRVRAQEMNGARWLGPIYWEGACEVAGSHRGAAYVELLGSLASPLARAVRHPAAALALATAAGRSARLFAPLRPIFPEGQVVPKPARTTFPEGHVTPSPASLEAAV